ncbi:MAG: hypothetical protein HN413_11190 [Chloroflexi bacterium]|nr:hypothetical protein [Chloroflexota bacterium]
MNWKREMAIFGGLAAIAAYIGGWMVALISIPISVGVIYILRGFTVVRELEVAVVRYRQTQAFSRFLPAGVRWIPPGIEYIWEKISVAVTIAKGSTQALTRDGHTLSVEWMLVYKLTPEKLAPERCPGMTRVLPKKADMLVNTHVSDCLRELLEQRFMDELLQTGVQSRLKRELRQRAAVRLANSGIEVYRVSALNVNLPQRVIQTIEAAHQRRHQAQADAEAYQIMRQAFDHFTDADMQWLELERIRVLAQHGNSTVIVPLNDEGHLEKESNRTNGKHSGLFQDLPLAR